ncbi:MAG TPA: TMEM175 family protein [Nitrospiria bacterium]|nr:TMEM175 family protein [Nitrospiria bacterium]
MHKSRIEAFSDGVIAIIITVMVLELKLPKGPHLSDLQPLISVGLCYVLSFIYLAIYWNNHHHLFQTVKEVNGAILWANIHLLFWLSLTPFVTAWAGENHFAKVPTAIYGFVLMMAGAAYLILTKTLIAKHGKDSVLAKALGKDLKGKLSVVFYAISVPLALWFPIVAFLIYILVAVIWIIPDSRIEREFHHRE